MASSHSEQEFRVQLSGIHLQGVLYAAGDVRYAGHVKVYGGVGGGCDCGWSQWVRRLGGLVQTTIFVRGWCRPPLVFVAPGSWQPKV